MPKRQVVQALCALSRKRMLSESMRYAMQADDEETFVLSGKRRRVHAFWMAPFLTARTDTSQRNTLAKLESDFIRLGCVTDFKKSTRMAPHIYKELLEMVRPLIEFRDTNWRKSIKPEERLSLTIRYLTRGDSVETLAKSYLVGESTVLPVVRDTCRAIYSVLHEDYMKSPSTEAEWKAISQMFHDRWNLPHVLGALDGKHVRIQKPKKSGSLYYNYKHYFSVVLFGLVDAEYKFLYVDCGAEGKASDSTLWKYSSFHRDVERADNPLGIPPPEPFPGFENDLAYYFVGDDAFEMSLNLMKPYPSSKLTWQQRMFNYRLSRVRRVVENAFGILATRFRIFRREIDMQPQHVSIIVMACVALHNYLRTVAPAMYLPREATDWEGKDYRQHKGAWRAERAMAGGEPTKVRNRSTQVKDMRNDIARWVLTKYGELKYQWDVVLEHDFYFQR